MWPGLGAVMVRLDELGHGMARIASNTAATNGKVAELVKWRIEQEAVEKERQRVAARNAKSRTESDERADRADQHRDRRRTYSLTRIGTVAGLIAAVAGLGVLIFYLVH